MVRTKKSKTKKANQEEILVICRVYADNSSDVDTVARRQIASYISNDYRQDNPIVYAVELYRCEGIPSTGEVFMKDAREKSSDWRLDSQRIAIEAAQEVLEEYGI